MDGCRGSSGHRNKNRYESLLVSRDKQERRSKRGLSSVTRSPKSPATSHPRSKPRDRIWGRVVQSSVSILRGCATFHLGIHLAVEPRGAQLRKSFLHTACSQLHEWMEEMTSRGFWLSGWVHYGKCWHLIEREEGTGECHSLPQWTDRSSPLPLSPTFPGPPAPHLPCKRSRLADAPAWLLKSLAS